MAPVQRQRQRAGRTEKVSVSLDRADLLMLRKRARRLHGGNLSAVIADGVRLVREEEGRQALLTWLHHAGDTTPEQQDAIRKEWRDAPVKRTRRSV